MVADANQGQDRQADAQIEMTPAMIEAGVLELGVFNSAESMPGEAEIRVREIFSAMISASASRYRVLPSAK